MQGAVYSDEEWTSLPPLEFEPVEREFQHYRLLDDGRVVLVSISPPGQGYDIDVVEVHTLADGAWTSEEFLRGNAAELSQAQAATSPAGDVAVWWGRRPTEGATLGDLVVALRPANAPTFGEPTAISARNRCIRTVNTPCAGGVVLDSGEVVIAYRSAPPDEVGTFNWVRHYNPDRQRWSKPKRLVPGRDSAEVDLRPDGRAIVHTHGATRAKDRMFECPTVTTCERVGRPPSGLDPVEVHEVFARPGGGAVAYQTTLRCPEEDCTRRGLRATVLGP